MCSNTFIEKSCIAHLDESVLELGQNLSLLGNSSADFSLSSLFEIIKGVAQQNDVDARKRYFVGIIFSVLGVLGGLANLCVLPKVDVRDTSFIYIHILISSLEIVNSLLSLIHKVSGSSGKLHDSLVFIIFVVMLSEDFIGVYCAATR